jgi:ribonuclease T1
VRWIAAAALLFCSISHAFVSEIKLSALPAEARQTLAHIKAGGPFPYAKDGTVFGNREGQLPKRNGGYYREYTVKTPGARDRGARRIVSGVPGEYYYSDDHYQTFRRIIE